MEPSLLPFPIDPPPPPIIPVLPTPAVTSAAVAATAANPTTAAVVAPTVTHPPYSDMICEAIGALKEKNGSSKRAIAKYIESSYKDLPPTHSALLTHHLKRLKNNGLLVMVKKSYKLASTARSEGTLPESTANLNGAAASPGPKRGRGRPPKPKIEPTANPSQPMLAPIDPNTQQPIPLTDGSKKSPGRPRKNGVASRGRGRPPKTELKKRPGRPRKPKTVRSVVGLNAVKRGRGRPPKSQTQLPSPPVLPIQGQPVAVPYADTAAATTVVASNLPRPRGRPKGTVRAAGAASGVAGKRRGRPPKLSGAIAKQTNTGKPVGRPRKITGRAEWKTVAASYADIKGKLEFFQLKVKQALEVLRPHYTRENNISVIDAFQELEGLAAMDINTPFTTAPPPVQPPVQLPVPNEG